MRLHPTLPKENQAKQAYQAMACQAMVYAQQAMAYQAMAYA
jgi:hypothetical protein